MTQSITVKDKEDLAFSQISHLFQYENAQTNFFFLNAEDFRCIFKENIIENIDDCHNITISFFIMRIRDYLAGFILYFVYK